jgi:HAMP domain-containing protein
MIPLVTKRRPYVGRIPLLRILFAALVHASSIQTSVAFSLLSPFNSRATFAEHVRYYQPSTRRLSNNRNDGGNQFDISKPIFDLLSFRLIRSDALLRYNSLNQSEPLRINLFLLATISLLGYPLWCESVTGDIPTLTSSVSAAGIGAACAALFWRERSRRSNQLKRMEKELNAGSLSVRLPVNTAISSVRPEVRLVELRSKRRIIAIRGSKEQLKLNGVLDTLCVLRKRFVQSQTLVVLVPTGGTLSKADWGLDNYQLGDALWLGDACNLAEWENYFSELVDNPGDKLAWFALNFNGRSIASGLNETPRLLELLGQQLQPMEILDKTDDAELLDGCNKLIAKQVLDKQRQFYRILTDSDVESEMQSIYSTMPSPEVDEVCFL